MADVTSILGPRPGSGQSVSDILGPRPGDPPKQSFSGSLMDSFFSWDKNPAGRILKAINQGEESNWGQVNKLEEDTQKFLKDKGVYNDWESGHLSAIKAANEAWIRPSVWALSQAAGGVMGALGAAGGGLQQLGTELKGGAAQLAKIPYAGPALATPIGGAGEMLEAAGGGQYLGELPMHAPEVEGVTEPPKEPTMGSFAPPPRVEPGTFQDLPDHIASTRSVGAIGEPESNFMGWTEPTEEEIKGRNQATGALKEPPPQGPSIHDVARAVAPDTFFKKDLLDTKQATLNSALANARKARDEPIHEEIKTILDKVKGIEDKLTNKQAERLQNLRDELEGDKDTTAIIALKKAHYENYLDKVALAPDIRTAYREAASRLGNKIVGSLQDLEGPDEEGLQPLPESQAERPTETPQEPSGATETAKEPQGVQEPPKGSTIAADVSEKLQKAGRPKEESDAVAAVVRAHYEARAARFDGKLGTAEELYGKEAPEIQAGKGLGKQQGSLTIRDRAKNVIRLFKTADPSTALHETGHQWLEELRQDAQHPDAPEGLKADWKTVQDWLGAEEGKNLSRKQHEQFARGFERYLLEGTAPSEELQGVFGKFKEWLSKIYDGVKASLAPINDDIRGVFDRLLKTPDQTVIASEDLIPHSIEEPLEEQPKPGTAETPNTPVQPTGKTYLQADGSFNLENISSYQELLSALEEKAGTAEDVLASKMGKVSAQDKLDLSTLSGQRLNERNMRRLRWMTAGDGIPLSKRFYALGEFFKQTAGKMRELLDKDNPSEDDVVAFAELTTLRSTVAQTLVGIRGEWGRTGHALRRMLEDTENEDDLNTLLQENVGKNLYQMQQIMKTAKDLVKTPEQAAKLDKLVQDPRVSEYFYAYMINGWLSGPITHTTYALGITGNIVKHLIFENYAAATVGTIRQAFSRNPIERVTFQEANDALHGALYGTRPAMQALKAAYSTGRQQGLQINDLISAKVQHEIETKNLPEESRETREKQLQAKVDEFKSKFTIADIAKSEERKTKLMTKYQGAELSAKIEEGINKGKIIDPALKEVQSVVAKSESPQAFETQSRNRPVLPGTLGRVIQSPTEKMVAPMHSINYVISLSSNLDQITSRAARMEGEAKGWSDEKITQRKAELTHDTPLEMVAEASDNAHQENLLQGNTKNGLISKLNSLLQHRFPSLGGLPALGLAQPFVTMVSNAWKAGVWTVALGNPVTIPAVLMFRKQFRNDFLGRNGGVAKDIAYGKMAFGTGLTFATWGLLEQGLMNGASSNKAGERDVDLASGEMPYGVNINGMSYDTERLGSLGISLAIMSDFYHFAKNGYQEGLDPAAATFIAQIGQHLANSSAISGIADLFGALEGRGTKRWINGFLVSAATPFSSGMRQTAAMVDPYERETASGDNSGMISWGEWNAFKKTWMENVPGVRQELPEKIDVFGQPIPARGFWGVYTRNLNNDPVFTAFKNSGYFPAKAPTKILGYTLTEDEYTEFAKQLGVTAKSLWDNDVSTEGFSSFSEAHKHDMLVKSHRNALNQVKSAFLADHLQISIDAAQKKLDLVEGTDEDQISKDAITNSISKDPYSFMNVQSNLKPSKSSEPYPDIQSAVKDMSNKDYSAEDKWRELMKTGKTGDITGVSGNLDKVLDFAKETLKDLTPNQTVADHIAKAFVSSRRNPIATLGFAPDRFAYDRDSAPSTIGGAYRPKDDIGFSTTASEDSLTHESIHRGLQLLKSSGKLTNDEKDFININDESIVRYVMAKDMGDPQTHIGKEGQKEREDALNVFEGKDHKYYSEEQQELLKSIEKKASQFFMEQTKTTMPTLPPKPAKGKK